MELDERTHWTNELAEFCNISIKVRVEKSNYQEKITVANLDTLYEYQSDHIFGIFGKQAYTNCILAAVESAGLRRSCRITNAANQSNNNTHINTFSNTPANTNTSNNIPTSNMFDPLSNLSN